MVTWYPGFLVKGIDFARMTRNQPTCHARLLPKGGQDYQDSRKPGLPGNVENRHMVLLILIKETGDVVKTTHRRMYLLLWDYSTCCKSQLYTVLPHPENPQKLLEE